MTRSVRRRQNAGARYAQFVFWALGCDLASRDGVAPTLDAAAAQRWASELSRRFVRADHERFAEVNWSYAAELMNRMAR